MNAARRNHKRRDWPRGLYESKPGYFIWRSKTGKAFALGKVPLASAKTEANAANSLEAGQVPRLVEKLSGSTHTIGDILNDMRDPSSVSNTVRTRRSQDKIIRAALGDVECRDLTVEKCAKVIEDIEDEGKSRSAEAVRGRLIAVCRRGQQLGWLSTNHASVTRAPKVVVKRGRLTMDLFNAIYAVAPKFGPWLQHAMLLGLVLGADRVTIAGLQRSNVVNNLLTYTRQKTGATVAVPLALRLNVIGVSLEELINRRSLVLSPYLIHHTRAQGQAKAGAPVHPETLTKAFTNACVKAGIPKTGAPTFHELRSLCKREYVKQGGVDTKALLGHAGERVSDLYADARGVEPILVRLG